MRDIHVISITLQIIWKFGFSTFQLSGRYLYFPSKTYILSNVKMWGSPVALHSHQGRSLYWTCGHNNSEHQKKVKFYCQTSANMMRDGCRKNWSKNTSKLQWFLEHTLLWDHWFVYQPYPFARGATTLRLPQGVFQRNYMEKISWFPGLQPEETGNSPM